MIGFGWLTREVPPVRLLRKGKQQVPKGSRIVEKPAGQGTDLKQGGDSKAFLHTLDRVSVAWFAGHRRNYSEVTEWLLAMETAELMNASGRTVAFVGEGTEIEVNRLVDDELLPGRFCWKTKDRREFDLLGAAAALRLNRKFKDLLTKQARRDLLEHLDAEYLVKLRKALRPETDISGDLIAADPLTGTKYIIEFKDLSLNVTREINEVSSRILLIAAAEDSITVDPEIMGGIPVFRGSRLPIETAIASMDAGVTLDDMIGDYPFLDADRVELARLYLRLHPRSGRPRKTSRLGNYRVVRTVHILKDEV